MKRLHAGSLGRRLARWLALLALAGLAMTCLGVYTATALSFGDRQAETLRQYQVGLFGGTPAELPEQHARSSPITYAARVEAPVLVIQGSNDTRCPARQLRAYEEQMHELGKDIRVEWFEVGHGSYDMEKQLAHQEMMMTFAAEVLAR